MAKRAKAKVNLPIIIAAILLCLTLFSIHLTSGVYARYTATASGSDSARVIKFGEVSITETGDISVIDEKASLVFVPGVDMNWDLTVDFEGSESATYVFVDITPTNWYTSNSETFYLVSAVADRGVFWTVDTANWTHLDATADPYVYYLSLDPNDTLSGTRLLVADGEGCEVQVGQNMTSSQLSALTGSDLSVTFRASVVQSNGFNSVADAWSSLEANH